MKRLAGMLLACCLLLSGCSWMDGSHMTVSPHEAQISGVQSGSVSASNYVELREVLENLVKSGTENSVINVTEYVQEDLEQGMILAVSYIKGQFPLGAYAVEALNYEIGTGGGHPAVSVSISYIHGRSEIRQVENAADMEAAKEAIYRELDDCGDGVVLLVDSYEETDIGQLVEDYAQQNPSAVMETPQVAVGIYPEMGRARVVELRFTYQSSREALRQMQTQVQRVFTSAVYYVNSDGSESQKFSQLYTFLMERSDYKLETSMTPSYSLLIHGVGDSKAFAVVYAAMCGQAGLDCLVVTGTRNGEPWYWNVICQDGVYYHMDLLRGSERMTEDEMAGYVWDYSAYPSA